VRGTVRFGGRGPFPTVDEYLDAGVAVVRVFDPERREIAIHSRDGTTVMRTDRDTLTAEGQTPDFAVPAA
jgi:hypothetical protein